MDLVPLHHGPSKGRLYILIFSACFEGNKNHELMFMLGTNALAPYTTSSPPSPLLLLFPHVVTYFGRYSNAFWTGLGKIRPHFELPFRSPFLIYNFRGFPVCCICKSFSSGYIFAGSSSFKDCFLLA